jgi:inorganic pyrophosphatase/exopolyphosphatase
MAAQIAAGDCAHHMRLPSKEGSKMNKETYDGPINLDTEIVQAVSLYSRTKRHKVELQELISIAQENQDHKEDLRSYHGLIRDRLSKAVFVGHVNTDLDSVAGAIGAAALFGGTPAISEPESSLNGEILYALKRCGIETPQLFDSIENSAHCDVVLVDHTEEKQMVPSIMNSPTRATRIIGILDHHALAKTFFTSKPIFMDLRPWGSVSTIIAILFISHRKVLPKPLAILLLQAILSDTLNLRSVTTTDADKGMVALLSTYGDISNTRRVAGAPDISTDLASHAVYQETEIDLLAKQQFQAKTDWILALGAYEMVRGDQKDFSCGPWKFGISVLEVTDSDKVLAVANQILLELRLLKKEKGLAAIDQANAPSTSESAVSTLQLNRADELDFAFLFVVNIVEQKSILLIPGGRELALAKAAFLEVDDARANDIVLAQACRGIAAPGSTIKPEETALFLPQGYVSRKAQFVPAFFEALEKDFVYRAKGPVSLEADSHTKYSEQDKLHVLSAIERSKQGKLEQPEDIGIASMDNDSRANDGRVNEGRANNSMAIFSDQSNPQGQLMLEQERAEEAALLAKEEILASQLDGNLYDENGRIRRSYGAAST